MVSFQCEGCGDIVKKPKCKQHQQRCHSPFTCIDCHQTFPGNSFQPHNQCMTESEKYQKGYKPPTNKRKQNTNSNFTNNSNGSTIQKSTDSNKTQPVSIIEQLKQKQLENNKRSLYDDKEELSNSATKQKKVKKEKKDKNKKTKLSEWSNEKLDTNEDRQIKLALEHILKKEKKTCSIETLRNNVVTLIVSHPKSSESPASYCTKFDQLVGLSFNSKKDKVTFSYLKT